MGEARRMVICGGVDLEEGCFAGNSEEAGGPY